MSDYYTGKDSWFDREWSSKITPPFAEWWSEYYGFPDDYDGQCGDDALHEYFTRMAFAFMGWQSAQQKMHPTLLESRRKMVTWVVLAKQKSGASPNDSLPVLGTVQTHIEDKGRATELAQRKWGAEFWYVVRDSHLERAAAGKLVVVED